VLNKKCKQKKRTNNKRRKGVGMRIRTINVVMVISWQILSNITAG